MANNRDDGLSTNLLLIGKSRLIGSGDQVALHYAGDGRQTRVVSMASVQDVDAAVACAKTALPIWRSLAPSTRRDMMLTAAQLLVERADRLAWVAAFDTGLTYTNVRGFVLHAAEWLRYYAGWIDKSSGPMVPMMPGALDYVTLEPYGIVGVISPSNSTVSAMILAPVLAAGNCAVVKPSSYTAQVVAEYLQVFLDAGIPPGVVNSVPGDGVVGEAIISNPAVRKIHFTGSCGVGAKVAALSASLLKPSALELEGKSANIIFEDADLDQAASVAMRAMVRQAGQSCVAGTRVIVHSSVIDELISKTIDLTRRQRIGMPLSPDSAMGPVISAAARDRILNVIERTCNERQGKLVFGGHALDHEFPGGFFISPTIFRDVDNGSPIAQQETFGPVISFITFETDQDAIEIANASEFGLAGYIHTRSLGRAHTVAGSLDVGTIWINGAAGILPGGPFGGVKNSGWGRVGGAFGLAEFSQPKNIWMAC